MPIFDDFIILAEIGRFDKSAEECVTARDRLFYWFRHAAEFTQMPDWLDDPESKAQRLRDKDKE